MRRKKKVHIYRDLKGKYIKDKKGKKHRLPKNTKLTERELLKYIFTKLLEKKTRRQVGRTTRATGYKSILNSGISSGVSSAAVSSAIQQGDKARDLANMNKELERELANLKKKKKKDDNDGGGSGIMVEVKPKPKNNYDDAKGNVVNDDKKNKVVDITDYEGNKYTTKDIKKGVELVNELNNKKKMLNELKIHQLRDKAISSNGKKNRNHTIEEFINDYDKDKKTYIARRLYNVYGKYQIIEDPSQKDYIKYIKKYNIIDKIKKDLELEKTLNNRIDLLDKFVSQFEDPNKGENKGEEEDEDEDEDEEVNENEEIKQGGKGNTKADRDAMDTSQIDAVMGKHKEYLGTLAHDQIPTVLSKIKPKSRICCIINTDPSSKSGRHWQAVFADARPGGSQSIEFYDSYADPPSKTIMQGIKSIVQRLNSDSYLKYKENKIRQQNGTSGNCGWFCCQFLIDRLRGKKFAECSGNNDMLKGEKDIVAFKKKHNINKFDYFNQDGQGIGSFLKRGIKAIGSKIGEVVDRFKGPLRDSDYPQVVRKFMYKFQYSPITSISIGRKPLNSIITRMGNWLSSGKLGEKEEEMNNYVYCLLMVFCSATH